MKRPPRKLAPAPTSGPKLTPAQRELVRFLAREYIRQRRERRVGKKAA